MTRTNAREGLRRAGALLLFPLLVAIAISFSLCVDTTLAFADTPSKNTATRYTNPDTGFSVVILDDYNLLTDEEEDLLVEDMKPITAYGNVAFWSTDVRASDEIDQARLKRKELFEYSSATIFVINMKIRKLTVQSYGRLYSVINDSRARTITDNVSSYATNRNYYRAAQECYYQMIYLMEGYEIPEPMKLTGYAMLSIILGFTIALIIAFSSWLNPLRTLPDEIRGMRGTGTLSKKWKKVTISEQEFTVSSGGSGGGCGGGGGGCGGGGCGGGGSSGF